MLKFTLTPEFILDMFQSWKANTLRRYVSDQRIITPVEQLIAAETRYTRQLIKTSREVIGTVFCGQLADTIKKFY